MNNLEINIGLDTLYINGSNNIIGEINFQFNNKYFPGEGWDDFVVIILMWWNKAMLDLNSSEQSEIDFDFMDGPFLIRANKIAEDTVKLSFIKRKVESEQILFIYQTSIKEFKNKLVKSTQLLLTELSKRDWKSDEIEELKKRCKDLSK